MGKDTILILDFGGQYCHLIARRVRENNVYSEVVPSDISANEIKALGKKTSIKGIILSGGPSSIYDKNAPKMDKAILRLGIPILGICYGHQLLADYVNGNVKRAKNKEYGIAIVNVKSRNMLSNLEDREEVWMSHGDTVLSMPKSFQILAHTNNCPIAAYSNSSLGIYGVQWHPEVVHTKHGNQILSNFIFNICKSHQNWKPTNLIQNYIKSIRDAAGDKKVIIAMSGGIDSSTAAVLAHMAIGKRLIAVFVDNGLMRLNEPRKIREIAKVLGLNLVVVNAKERFLENLRGVTDPERKRKIIGNEFIRVFEEHAKKINADYLLQGTIYPDRIESGYSKNSSVIKTHHNVGGLPKTMKFKGLIEPLKDL
ncbi:MAG: glutamine-hydrolyzing GMP synthase, partial [Candidatus Micrarchaeota archaeon]|nr:glutamine-hydrolyzing GMP synthase [Candidatus Micrarchaeota archaeon]